MKITSHLLKIRLYLLRSIYLIAGIVFFNNSWSQSGEICFASATKPDIVNAKSTWTINPGNQTVTIRTTLAKTFVDNTYGTNIIGWPGAHKFTDLTGSDKLQLALYDGSNTKKLEFAMDYMSSGAPTASTYGSLGVSGGDGSMIFGNASNILSVTTSLDRNFNAFGYTLTTNSPLTNANYSTNASYPNWIYEVWYEVTVKLIAFGANGFGKPLITKVHASPSKTGKNEETVVEGPCPVFSAVVVTQNMPCSSYCKGSIDVTASNGTPPYTYKWQDGPETEDRQDLCAGSYSVTVKDANGLQTTVQAVINNSTIKCSDEICLSSPTIPNIVNANISWTFNADQTVTIKTTFAKTFVDNTYGANAIGWPGGHTFSNLTGSDKLQLALYDGGNTKKMEFAMDYISSGAPTPSTYGSLGVSGGDGDMILGSETDIVSVKTSLDKNFNDFGYVLTSVSPATNASYTTNPLYPSWIFEVWYEVKVKLSAFGAAGFKLPVITSIHASPSKTGNNTEIVEPCPKLTAAAVGTSPGCYAAPCTGSINLTITNGKAPYDILWDNGSQSEDLQGLCTGTYKVTVTDANGIVATAQATITPPSTNCSGQICFASPTIPNIVNAKSEYTINADQTVTIKTTFAKTFNDNTYGLNAIGWAPGSHSFSNLTGSDKLQLALYDGGNTKKLEFEMDYISAKPLALAPSGYGSLGVTGGDGGMIFGSASDIVNVVTSLDKNFNDFGYVLTSVSPATNASYTPNPSYPSWIFEVWYEVKVKLSAFGPAGFGSVLISDIHASPSKTGNNTEIVLPIPCPAASIGNFVWYDNNKNGVQDIGENGVPDVTVKLYKCDNTFIKSMVTDASGLYLFSNLEPGNYYVVFDKTTLPTGYVFTDPNVGADDKDSDADVVTGKAVCEVLVDQESNLTYDAGIYKLCSTDLTLEKTDVLCNGGSTGTVKATFGGGTAPYRIKIDGGSYAQQNSPYTFMGLAQGSHTVYVLDAFDCLKTDVINVDEPPALTLTLEKTDVLCNGGSTGTVKATFGGGKSPYRVKIDGGSYAQHNSPYTFMGLAQGLHTVYLLDANDCPKSEVINVDEPPALTLTLEKTDVLCNGGSTGTVKATFGGGKSPYRIKIDGGSYAQQNSPYTFMGLAQGSHTVYLLDANDCPKSEVINVDEPPALTLTLEKTDVLCNGGSTGTVKATFGGGKSPYRVKIDGGSYAQHNSPYTFMGLSQGSHTVYLLDANDCPKSEVINVDEPPALTLTLEKTDVLCNGGSTGTVKATFGGGKSPYRIKIDGGSYAQHNSPYTFMGLSQGSHTVYLLDANDCPKSEVINVGEPPALTLTLEKTDVLCNGGSTGTVKATFGGGKSPYRIKIDGGSYAQQNSPYTFMGLSQGSHTVYLLDANDCPKSEVINVDEPPALTLTLEKTDVLCNGGSTGTVKATFGGGKSPYRVKIDGGSYAQQNSPYTFMGLSQGSHTVYLLDANDCPKSEVINVGEPPALTLTLEKTDVLCNGGSTGTVKATFGGGKSPYRVKIDGGSYAQHNSPYTFMGLSQGSHTVYLLDANDCPKSEVINVGEPPALTLTLEKTDVLCNGGSTGTVKATFGGGKSPYRIKIDGGSYAQQNSPYTFMGLSQGSHTVYLLDANDCLKSEVINLGEPPALTLTLEKTDVLCNGGSTGTVKATFGGGKSPYRVKIDGGSYAQQNSPYTFMGLAQGLHTVYLLDANDCPKSEVINVGEPPALTLTLEKTDVLCNGGSTGTVKATFGGGKSPYRIKIDGGSYAQQNSPYTFMGLAQGLHTVYLLDANDCPKQAQISLGQPQPLIANSTKADVTCTGANDGCIYATAAGGTPPYSFALNGMTNNTGTFCKLAPGNYTITVTDANGCTTTTLQNITEPNLASCNNNTITVDENVTINFNTNPPTYTGEPDLLPYFTYEKSGATPDTWKAIFTLGANKLLIKNKTITTTQVNGYAPGIQITGDCNMEIENNGHIIVLSNNKPAGDIDVQMNGNILVNGEVRNEVTGTLGLPGHITMISKSGSFTEGITGLIQILGIDPGANVITLQTCGAECAAGDINISGLVKSYAHAHAGDLTMNRPNINVISLNGAVTINANTSEPLYDEFGSAGGLYDIYGGLLSWVRDNVNPGNIKVQAKKDITVNGHGTDPTGSVRKSFGALAAIATGGSSPGGTIDVRSLEGNIIASNRSFDVSGRNLLSTNFANIRLHAKQNITLTRPGANNNFNPVVDASAPSSGSKGGTNEIRSFSGGISVGVNAIVSASVPAGSGSVQGVNLLTSCTGVSITGTVTPADLVPGDNSGTCAPTAPTALFENCLSIGGNLRTMNRQVSIVPALSNVMANINTTPIFGAYPNPTKGIITIKHQSTSTLKTEIKITDASGKRTFVNHMFNSFIGTNYYQLDLSKYASGIYIILVKNNKKEDRIKIIKL